MSRCSTVANFRLHAEIMREKKKRRKSLFPKSSMADNRGKLLTQQDCTALARFVFAEGLNAVFEYCKYDFYLLQ